VTALLVFGFLAFAYIGAGYANAAEAEDGFVSDCVKDTVKMGVAQDKAQKKCECVVGIMKKKLDSDQMEFMKVAKTRDAKKMKEFVDKKGQEWIKKTSMDIAKLAPEFAQNCK
jgi:hypothetical protein